MANRYPYASMDMSQLSVGQVPGPRLAVTASWATQTMTQHVPSTTTDHKHKEYLKQQERLRFMAASAHKAPVSADALIENLMGKEETFKPKAHSIAQTPPAAPQYFGVEPPWLQPTSPQFPALYRAVWALVGQPSGLADTVRLSPLLLTSGLPTEVLGFIWGVANQRVPGCLTERETYLVLALIALAQSGCTFNSLNVLNLIPQPPIPTLTLPFAVPETKQTSSINTVPVQPLPTQQCGSLPDPVKTHVAPKPDDDFDEFTDFQSATVIPSSPCGMSVGDPPSNSLQSPPVVSSESKCDTLAAFKFPSVMVVGGTNRSVGSRLANHSLGTPRANRGRHHRHHRHQHQSSSQPPDDEFSEFQQGKNTADLDELFPKCGKKQSHTMTYPLKESAIRVEGEDSTGGVPELLVLDEKTAGSNRVLPIGAGALPVPAINEKSISVIKEKPVFSVDEKPVSLIKDKSVLSVDEKPASVCVTEDRYSALRDLFTSDSNGELNKLGTELLKTTTTDDFGDFHSADDLFTDIANRETVNVPVTTALQDCALPAWKTATAGVSDVNKFAVNWDTPEVQPVAETQLAVLDQTSDCGNRDVQWNKSGVETDLVSSFLGLDLGGGSSFSFPNKVETFKVTSATDNVLCQNWQPSKITESSPKVQGFLGQIYSDALPAKQDNDVLTIAGTQDDDDEFGEFVGPEAWQEERKAEDGKDLVFDEPPVGTARDLLFYDNQSVSSLELPPLTLSRHGSVPSLDLKVYPITGEKSGAASALDLSPQGQDRQLGEWIRCLQSCLSLLQAAVDTLGSISSDQVLDEVLGAPEGKGYLQGFGCSCVDAICVDLHEVYGLCRRMELSYVQLALNDPKVDSFLASVNAAWASLQNYYLKADISVSAECRLPDSGVACGVCLAMVSGVEAGSVHNTRPLEYAGRVYHAACANLWVNCVDSSLPALLPCANGLL